MPATPAGGRFQKPKAEVDMEDPKFVMFTPKGFLMAQLLDEGYDWQEALSIANFLYRDDGNAPKRTIHFNADEVGGDPGIYVPEPRAKGQEPKAGVHA
jgi:hypothetical protein